MSEREGDQVRLDLLKAISRLSDEHPDLRICQLIGNAIPPQESARRGKDIYYIEDSQLLNWLLTYEARAMAAASLNDEIGSTV